MKLLRRVSPVLLSLLLVAGCSNGGDPAPGGEGSEQGENGGETGGGRTDASVAVSGEVSSLDPTRLSTAFTSGGDRATAIFGSLMKYDSVGNVVPAMAESLESDDLQNWTLTLRDGMTFTDGTPYDADAVVFNINRHIAEDSISAAKSLFSGLESLEVSSPLTIEFKLAAPSGSFPSLLTNNATFGYVGSPTAIEADEDGFGGNPVGAGPFMIDEWVRDSHLALKKNPDYWDSENVALEKLEFVAIVENQTRTQALKSKEIDMMPASVGSQWIQFRDLEDEFTIYMSGSLGAQAWYPNLSRGPFQDYDLRRAVQMVFNSAEANEILNANAIEWDGNHDCLPFKADSESCAPGAYPDENIDEAMAFLDDYFANGGERKITFLSTTIMAAYHDYYVHVLTQLGFEVDLQAYDLTQYAGATREGNYDAMAATRLPFVDPFPAFFNMISQGGSNYPKQNDPEFQEALENARDALPEDQDKAWGEVNRQLGEKAYAFWVAPSSNRVVSVAEFHPGNDYTIGSGVWYPAEAYFD